MTDFATNGDKSTYSRQGLAQRLNYAYNQFRFQGL